MSLSQRMDRKPSTLKNLVIIKPSENEAKHVCTLPPMEDVIVKFIAEGHCVPLRRKLKSLLMVNPDNPFTREFLLSSFLIRKEMTRHLIFYPHMIHPLSTFRMAWECLMIFAIAIGLIYMPVAAISTQYATVNYPMFFIDLIGLIDVIRTFFTGIYREKFNDTVLSPRIVASLQFASKHICPMRFCLFYCYYLLVDCARVEKGAKFEIFREYIHGYFVLDLFTTFPQAFLPIPIDYLIPSRLVKFFRIFRLIEYLNRFQKWKQYKTYQFKAVRHILIIYICIIWISTLTYLLVKTTPEHWFHRDHNKFVMVFLRVHYFFFLYGCSKPHSVNHLPVTLEIITMNLGFSFSLYVVVLILQYIKEYNAASSRYKHLKNDLHRYIAHKELPENLEKRLLTYFSFRFQKQYYDESLIMKTLSNNLRDEIMKSICQKIMIRVDIFSVVPPSILLRISAMLKSKIYLPGDSICTAGVSENSMYFIVTGTVAVYSENGLEISHLYDRDSFGEIALLKGNNASHTIIAVDPCDIYVLNRKSFFMIMENYPYLLERMQHLAQIHLEKTKNDFSTTSASKF